MSEATKHIGEKFNSDGSIRYFPGATIISHLEESNPMHMLMSEIRRRAEESNFADYLGFLPPSSFHMTVFELYCDFNRYSEKWSSRIDCLLPSSEVNRILFECVNSVTPPEQITMAIDYVDINSIRLLPADNEAVNVLRAYRNALSDATGICFPNHESYQYHMTYAYILRTLDSQAYNLCKRFIANETAEIKKKISTFTIGKPEMCLYSTMESFSSYSHFTET